jgi:hypothetical protein
MTSAGDRLPAAIAEPVSLFPDCRVGQLAAGMIHSVGRHGEGAIWEAEDNELLAPTRSLIDRNRPLRAPIAEKLTA